MILQLLQKWHFPNYIPNITFFSALLCSDTICLFFLIHCPMHSISSAVKYGGSPMLISSVPIVPLDYQIVKRTMYLNIELLRCASYTHIFKTVTGSVSLLGFAITEAADKFSLLQAIELYS